MDALYGEFISIQLSVLPDYGELIPGIGEAITTIQERGIAVAGWHSWNVYRRAGIAQVVG
ncbi:MAG: hypothetical protein VCB26_14890 [Candidatus Hydrogenedentota bacterium]